MFELLTVLGFTFLWAAVTAAPLIVAGAMILVVAKILGMKK